MPKRLSALILDTDHVTDRTDSERRWIVVGFGWGGPEVAHVVGPPGHASIPILSAFGGDAMSPVLGAGAPACGHHRGPVAAVLQRRVGFGCRHTAGRPAQAGKQRRAARCGDIGSPRRRCQNHCSVGQLLITPHDAPAPTHPRAQPGPPHRRRTRTQHRTIRRAQPTATLLI